MVLGNNREAQIRPRTFQMALAFWVVLVLLKTVVSENEARLAVPLSVDCSEESSVAVTSVLLEDPMAGSGATSRLALNITVDKGSLSFGKLSDVKLISGNFSGDNSYSMVASLYHIQRTLATMTYTATGELEGGDNDTISFSVARMSLNMGSWNWDHSPWSRSLRVNIINSVKEPTIVAAERLTTTVGSPLAFGVVVNWEEDATNTSSMYNLTATATSGSLAVLGGQCAGGVCTLSDLDAEALNAAAANFTFDASVSDLWLEGITQISLSVTASAMDGTGASSTATRTILVAVKPAQSTPRVSAPSSVSIGWNEVINFVSETSNQTFRDSLMHGVAIAVSDSDYGDIVTLNISATYGKFVGWQTLLTYSGNMDEDIISSVATTLSSIGSANVNSEELAVMERLAMQRYQESLLSSLNGDHEASPSLVLYGPVTYINQALTKYVYVPPLDWSGLESLEYEAYDLALASSSGSVSIIVSPGEKLPYITAINTYSGTEDKPVVLSGVTVQGMTKNEIMRATLRPSRGHLAFYKETLEYDSTFFGTEALLKGGCVVETADGDASTCLVSKDSTMVSADQDVVVLTGDYTSLSKALSSFVFVPNKHVNKNWISGTSISTAIEEYDVVSREATTDATRNVLSIALEAVNDAPVIKGLAPSTLVEDEPSLLFTSVSIEDVDADEPNGYSQLTLTIATETGRFAVYSRRATTGCGDACDLIASLDFAIDDLVVTTTDHSIVMIGSLADVNKGIRLVQYHPAQDVNGEVLITASVSDSGSLSSTEEAIISITSVNDFPVVHAPFSHVLEPGLLQSSIPGISVTDPDYDQASNYLNPLTVSVDCNYGNISVDTDAVAFAVGAMGEFSSKLALKGPLTGINKALASMLYKPADSFAGLDRISIEVSDNGYSGESPPGYLPGVSLTSGAVVSVVVQPVVDTSTNVEAAIADSSVTTFSLKSHTNMTLDVLTLENVATCDSSFAGCYLTLEVSCANCAWIIGDKVADMGVLASNSDNSRSLIVTGLASRLSASLQYLTYLASNSLSVTDTLLVRVKAVTSDKTLQSLSVPVSIAGGCKAPSIDGRERLTLYGETPFSSPFLATADALYVDPVVDELVCRLNTTHNPDVISMTLSKGSTVVSSESSTVVDGGGIPSTTMTYAVYCGDLSRILANLSVHAISDLHTTTMKDILALNLTIEVPKSAEISGGTSGVHTFSELSWSTLVYLRSALSLPTLSTVVDSFSSTGSKSVPISGLGIARNTVGAAVESLEYQIHLRTCYGALAFGSYRYYTQLVADSACIAGHATRSILRGSLASLNSALAKTTYTPAESTWLGVDAIRLTIIDPTDGTSGETVSVSVTVTAVTETSNVKFASNRAKTVIGLEDTPVNPFVGLSVLNPAGTAISLYVSVPYGRLSVSDLFSTEVLTTTDGNGGSTLTFQSSEDVNVDDILRAVLYTGAQDMTVLTQGPVVITLRLVYGLLNDQYVDNEVQVILHPVDDAPLISSSVAELKGTRSAGVSLGDLSVSDSDSEIVVLLFWLDKDDDSTVALLSSEVPEGLGVRNLSTTVGSLSSALFMHGSVSTVQAALSSVAYMPSATTTRASLLVTALNASEMALYGSSDADLVSAVTNVSPISSLDLPIVVIEASSPVAALGSIVGKSVASIGEDSPASSLFGITLKSFNEAANYIVRLNVSSGSLYSDANTPVTEPFFEMAGPPSTLTSAMANLHFRPLSNFNGVVYITALVGPYSKAGLDNLAENEILSSTFGLVVSPVNDGPSVEVASGSSGCLFEGCDFVITIDDIDASDVYCPLARGNYFLVTLSFNASVSGAVSLPGSMGLSSLLLVENSSSTTMMFHAAVSHFNGVPLSVTLNLNDSDFAYTGTESTYIEAQIIVSDEGRCGGEILEIKKSNASVVLEINPMVVAPTALSTESTSTTNDSSQSVTGHSVSSLPDDAQIDLDLLEAWQLSSRKVLHGMQFFDFAEVNTKATVGMRITCIDENSCGDG